MRTEKEVMEKYEELIKEYPNDMDMVQDRIICYMEDARYKSTKNNIIEVPLEELNNYSYNIDAFIDHISLKRNIGVILQNLSEADKYIIYHRFYLDETYEHISKISGIARHTITQKISKILFTFRIQRYVRLIDFLESDSIVSIFDENNKDLIWAGNNIANSYSEAKSIDNEKRAINGLLNKIRDQLDIYKKMISYINGYAIENDTVSKGDPGYYLRKLVKICSCINRYNTDFDDPFKTALKISGINKLSVWYEIPSKEEAVSIYTLFMKAINKKDIFILNEVIHKLKSILKWCTGGNPKSTPLLELRTKYFHEKYRLPIELKDKYIPDFVMEHSKLNDIRHISEKYHQIIYKSKVEDYLNFSEHYIPKNISDNNKLLSCLRNVKKISDICPDFVVFGVDESLEYSNYVIKEDPYPYVTIYEQIQKSIFVDHDKRSYREMNAIKNKPKRPISLYRQIMFEDLKSEDIKPNPGNVKGALCYMMDTNSFIRCRAGVTYSDIRYNIKTDKINDDDTPNCKVWINNNPKESSKIIKALFINGVIDVDNKKIHTNISMSKINMHMIFYTIKDFLEETEKNHGYKWNYSRMGGIAYIYVTMLDTLYMFCNCFGYELVD